MGLATEKFLRAGLRVIGEIHRIIFLPALATEAEWKQNLVAVLRRVNLAVNSQVALFWRFDRCVKRVATADELMETEGEDRKSRSRVADAGGSGEQCFGNDVLAAFGRCTGELGETFGSAILPSQGNGRRTNKTASLWDDAKCAFNPAGDGVRRKLIKCFGQASCVGCEHCAEGSDIGGVGLVNGSGGTFQGFTNNVGAFDGVAEQASSQTGDIGALLLPRTASRQRCRGANALHRIRIEQFPHAAQQQRHIRTLATAVGVKFIEHQEFQTLRGGDELLLAWPGENQFQHDVIRQQDVRRRGDDPRARFFVFLSGVALEGDRTSAAGKSQLQKLFQFPILAVGQGIHGVDDDCLNPAPRASA